MAARKKVEPVLGIIVITVSVGSIPPKEIPPYLEKIATSMGFGEGGQNRLKKNYEVFFLPKREDGPSTVEVHPLPK